MSSPVLAAQHIVKSYTYGSYRIPAVGDVSFELAPGEFVGLFGPNGAGKTTVTKLCVGLLAPESGSVLVGGHDMAQRPADAKRLIGYLPQATSLLASLTVAEELGFQARSYGLDRGAAARNAGRVAELMGVPDLLPRGVSSLSGGQRRRVELALALVHEPRVLILDEPTLGLDPETRAGLWDTIGRIRVEAGTAILMTTHYLDEAADLMSHVIIMDHGRIVASGPPADIVASHAKGRVTVGSFADPEEVLRKLAPHVEPDAELSADGSRIVVHTADPQHVLPVVIEALRDLGVRVTEAETTRAGMSAAFFAITGRKYVE